MVSVAEEYTELLRDLTSLNNTIQRQLLLLNTDLEASRKTFTTLQKAITLCNHCLQEQTDAKVFIEKMVTAIIKATNYGDVEFELQFTEKAGRVTGLKPILICDGKPTSVHKNGDGIRNIISFALRLIFLAMNPQLHQILIMDEPLTKVDTVAWELLIEFLQAYQKDLDLQIICVTHVNCTFPKTLLVEKHGNVSTVSEV